jgi:hypothetical protein
MERLLDVFYDTTGGCQRNERVLLGKNSRPMGWIAYVSPSEFDGILDPIGIQPDTETILEELRDPYLFSRNAADSGEALANCHQLLDQLGVRKELQPLGR